METKVERRKILNDLLDAVKQVRIKYVNQYTDTN